MLIRRTLAAALTTSLLLLSACSSHLPLQNAQAPRLAASVNVLSTNGALNLIEEMAHAEPQEFARIEAAFQLEIAKSTRPSLDKIISNAIDAIHHHPLPDGDILSHPVVRLIQASLNRYVHIMSQNLIGRMMLIFAFANLAPEQHEAQLQKLQRSLTSLPKMDAKYLLDLLNGGFFASEVAPGSALEARLQRLLEERMAARF